MAFRSHIFKIAWLLAIAGSQAARGRPVLAEGSITLVLLQPTIRLEGCKAAVMPMHEYLMMT